MWKLVAAFAAVYLIWGSTYLAIKFAIQTMPPFTMAGVRFLIAGTILYGFARATAPTRPDRAHWKTALVIGALLLMGGNGAVTWSQQRIPSGVAALLVTITPCWMVLLDWLRPGGTRPTAPIVVGLVLGLAGVGLLIGPESLMGGERVDLIGAGVLLIGSISWASGSIYSRHANTPARPLLATGMQMLCGGSILLAAGLLAGEATRIDLAAVSARSLLALAYLIVFGAIIGYSAYVWLLRASTPARVSTYAYVNPVIAVFLGWVLADEPLTPRMLVAALVIIVGVALITLSRQPAAPGPSPSTGSISPEPLPERAAVDAP
ncbi:MAG: EamA family transporter [Gemmatimonadetes bacterium]|nr:EamA family transporter [Gemmatimonadota bacterium]